MSQNQSNPLAGIPFRIPFDRIRAPQVRPAVEELLRRAQLRLETVASPGVPPGFANTPRGFANTMDALDRMSEELDVCASVVHHLEAVATTPEWRAAYNDVEPLISAFYSRIPLDEGLWRALNEYAGTPEARELAGARRRYVVKTIEDFRRHGAGLAPDGKQRLEKLDVELSRLTTKFSENVLDSTNAFELLFSAERQLAGLPPSAVEAARESARSKDKPGWRFTLQQPSYQALMTYLDDRAVREQVWNAYQRRATEAPYDNRELLLEILKLRAEKAAMLGFADFSDFAVEDRMAKSGARAQAFLEDLRRRTAGFFVKENSELAAFRRELEGPSAPDIQPWDVACYAEKLRKARFDFDEETLRPYFPLPQVIDGLFEIAHRLFGVRVVEESGVPAWDQAVRYYRIHDEDGAMLGAFYADWFPRENKRGGAWMDAFFTGGPRDGRFDPHLGLMCGNLTPPTPTKPSLLTHHEVETIFHEFGHLLHHCLSTVEMRGQAGTHVAWDFVELPSQIMENWCWERESLDLFARHYQTGELIPPALFERMRAARGFRAANAQMRQIGFGMADLALHREYSPERDGDPAAYCRALLQHYTPAPLPSDYAMILSFSHLFSSPVGYAAGYYSYKWAEVLDADAFTRFRKEGIFNRKVGEEFRRAVLSRGDSEDPSVLYREFMGRDPDPQALLERAGLVREA